MTFFLAVAGGVSGGLIVVGGVVITAKLMLRSARARKAAQRGK